MNEVESAIEKNHRNNFNNVLFVFSAVDSGTIKSESAQLNDCIKKASIAIQRHQNSVWVDDCFILIGKARYYLGDFVNAIETFKYVNSKSKDDNARHEALILLMRTFIDHNEDNNAISVSDYLNKEKLSFENRKKLSLTRAYYYQKFKDYDNVVKYLVEAAPYLKRKENSDRIHFIIGQIYQLKGFESEAYNYYNQCLNSNPSFEFSFYSKLNMAQVTQLTEEQDIRKVRKYFKSLLNDRKNAEFKDKIYFEMANFEFKQKNVRQAIEFYELSVKSSVNNQRQKGYSFLRLGEIYFDNLKNYELAKEYYDSVVNVLPKDDEIFNKVQQRQKVLEDFVTQVEIIHDQDSLLLLSDMDSTSLNILINQVIETQNKKAEEEKKKASEKQQQNIPNQTNVFQAYNDTNISNNSSGTTWYYYNLNAIGIGQNEFKRIWGDRKLEDHWRRSNKGMASQFDDTNDNVKPATENKEVETNQTAASGSSQKAKMLEQIPYTPEAKKNALEEIEKAYYNLGNIYNFKLEEKSNAAIEFETLLRRFPTTNFEPEVRYLLYLVYNDLDSVEGKQLHADSLILKFPNSIFSKLIANPNYREESNVVSEKLKLVYDKAYRLYENGKYSEALAILKEADTAYPDNDFSDNLKLLQIFLTGKIEGIYKYQFELQEFKKKYPDSELLGYADTLLTTSLDFQKEQLQKKEIQYVQYFDQVHYFVAIYPSKNKLADQLPGEIDEFNKSKFPDSNLKNGNLIFDEENSMIIVNEFPGTNQAIDYYKAFNDNVSLIKDTPSVKIYNFVISKDNFQILYQTKGLNEYLEFFRKNY